MFQELGPLTQAGIGKRVPMPPVQEIIAVNPLDASPCRSQADPEMIVLPARDLLIDSAHQRPPLPAKCRTAVHRIPLQQHVEGTDFRDRKSTRLNSSHLG